MACRIILVPQEVTRWDMVVNKNILVKVNRIWNRLGRNLPCAGICYLCSCALKTDEFLICAPCKYDLPLNTRACTVCAMPVPAKGTICGVCLQTDSRPVGKTFALFKYTFPVNRLIHDLKFNARIEIAAFLGEWMARVATEQGLSMPQCFIPVPLHKSRVAERGYNQSLEIARAISHALNIPVNYNLCDRIINTPPQSGMTAALRGLNIRGAFATAAHCVSLPGHAVLVDDVITTGATVNELARVLRANGVERVDFWVSARTTY